MDTASERASLALFNMSSTSVVVRFVHRKENTESDSDRRRRWLFDFDPGHRKSCKYSCG